MQPRYCRNMKLESLKTFSFIHLIALGMKIKKVVHEKIRKGTSKNLFAITL